MPTISCDFRVRDKVLKQKTSQFSTKNLTPEMKFKNSPPIIRHWREIFIIMCNVFPVPLYKGSKSFKLRAKHIFPPLFIHIIKTEWDINWEQARSWLGFLDGKWGKKGGTGRRWYFIWEEISSARKAYYLRCFSMNVCNVKYM